MVAAKGQRGKKGEECPNFRSGFLVKEMCVEKAGVYIEL